MANQSEKLQQILESAQTQLLAEWVRALRSAHDGKTRGTDHELQSQCQEFIAHLRRGLAQGGVDNIHAAPWKPMLEFLASISRSQGLQGASPSETALFVLSFKLPLFTQLRADGKNDVDGELTAAVWQVTLLLDKLGLYTIEVHQTAREELIGRQREEMLELSTPVIQLWEGVLALPIIGTLDSNRTQVVMEALLQQLVATRSPIAILDITGVPTVDTMTAQHLLKTVAAARLMGAECIISGIRPQIAQTIVHLGVDLGDVKTKASLADAFAFALKRLNLAVRPVEGARSV